jgi:hypothetical protein
MRRHEINLDDRFGIEQFDQALTQSRGCLQNGRLDRVAARAVLGGVTTALIVDFGARLEKRLSGHPEAECISAVIDTASTRFNEAIGSLLPSFNQIPTLRRLICGYS